MSTQVYVLKSEGTQYYSGKGIGTVNLLCYVVQVPGSWIGATTEMAFYPSAKQHWLILFLNSEKEFLSRPGKKGRHVWFSPPCPSKRATIAAGPVTAAPLQKCQRLSASQFFVSQKEKKKWGHYCLICLTHGTFLGVKSEAYNSGWSCFPHSPDSAYVTGLGGWGKCLHVHLTSYYQQTRCHSAKEWRSSEATGVLLTAKTLMPQIKGKKHTVKPLLYKLIGNWVVHKIEHLNYSRHSA